ncbi:MAG: FadR family transcriptional regulator [Syntrophorhabdaceae bacterium]|nr:FadR family transcriptional regulator [Syntrophorhabdaceae bacterium]
MARFKPVKQFRVSEEVAEQIKKSILQGTFRAGDRLPSERDLTEEFQVSRMAIREALRSLEKSGFIVTRQGVNGGAYVTDLTSEHLVNAYMDLFLAEKISIPDLYQVRLVVEPEVARLAANNLNEGYKKRLLEALEQEDLPVQDFYEDNDRKTAVHFILAEMSRNYFFEALVRSLIALTRRVIEEVRAENKFIHPAGMHRPVVEAILTGDGEAAYEAMKKHVKEFGENLIKLEKAYYQKKITSLSS